ncbi:MAG TPA: hypothetical protein VL984_01315, partial [Acidimicrobiales bacterium]|nr:hypothetical protein [Acidimicrobiales bacterium]
MRHTLGQSTGCGGASVAGARYLGPACGPQRRPERPPRASRLVLVAATAAMSLQASAVVVAGTAG